MFVFECLNVAPLSVADVRRGTNRDPLLSKVRTFTRVAFKFKRGVIPAVCAPERRVVSVRPSDTLG